MVDYTTLDKEILDDAARLTANDLLGLSREGSRSSSMTRWRTFTWPKRSSTSPRGGKRLRSTGGICGPIGPTEQLPLVARLVNELDLNLRYAHFWPWTSGSSTVERWARVSSQLQAGGYGAVL